MQFLQFLFASFWNFLGVFLFLGAGAFWMYSVLNRFWRHRNIYKCGYPPAHCDADGFLVRKERVDRTKRESVTKEAVQRAKDLQYFLKPESNGEPAKTTNNQ